MKNNKIKKEIRILKEKIKELEKSNIQLKHAKEMIQENEKKYLAILEKSQDAKYIYREQRFLFVNNILSKITGYTKKKLYNMYILDLIHSDDKKRIIEIEMERAKGKIVPCSYEARIICKKRKIRNCEFTAFPILHKGKLSTLCSVRDITTRKNPETLLKKNITLNIINKLLLKSSTHKSVSEVAAHFLMVAEKITESKFGFIGEVNPMGRFDTIAISNPVGNNGKTPQINDLDKVKNIEIQGIWGKVITDKRSLIVNDPESAPFRVGTPEGHPDLTSFLGVPLIFKGKIFGIIALSNKEGGYISSDKNIIESISLTLVEVLIHKRLDMELEKQSKNLKNMIVERTNELINTNKQLENEIIERKNAEKELKKRGDNLEKSVKKRTLTLEEKTKEIKESQQALSLLLEDVNDSRNELQAKTNELNRSLKNTENEKDKIDAILKSIGDGLIVTDLDNKVILMNNVAEDLLNVRLNEILNKPLGFIFDKKLQEKFNFTISEVEKGYQFDFELPSKNSKNLRIYNATASPIKDIKDKITGIITNFHDVTQEHRIDQMKTDFISTAAHELRTPLTAIQGFSEILNIRDDLDDADKKKFLNHINRQSINLGNIINDMLDISRIESGRGFSLKLEKCKINEEILRTCSVYEISYPNYLFYVYLPDKELEVFIDRGKIEQVMENLLSNAVKYSTQGSKISIKAEISGNKYIVSVEDEGIGISSKDLSRVFEKFFRCDYSNTSTKGTGLGMSIVKHIIEAHKGKVWLESKLGKGTKAHFSIPIPLKKIN